MADKFNSIEIEKVPCYVCRKEVPLSEAVSPEAVDYVAHFCGLDCYAQWKRQSERAKKQGEKTKK